MMDPISVPFAPTPYKIVCGIPLLTFAALALSCGVKNLRLCIRMLKGKLPLPPGSSSPFVVVGIFFYIVVLAAGSGATVFFVALETTQPTIISQDGILVGAEPPHYRQRLIPWDEITKVTCNLPPRENRIRSLRFYSHDSQVELGNAGLALDGVLAIATTRAPRGRNSAVRTRRARSFVVLLGGPVACGIAGPPLVR
jgi:hypothetical protein